MPTLEEFARLIKERAFIESDKTRFALVSERLAGPGQWLFDFRSVILEPRWLDFVAEAFWKRFADKYPFQVGGAETLGIALVAAIVMKGVEHGTPVNGFFIRKSRKRTGLMKNIEGFLNEHPIILVDDIVNSGRTFEKQIVELTDRKKRVSDLFTILAFRDASAYTLARKRNVVLHSLFTLPDFGLKSLSSTPQRSPRRELEIVWHFQAGSPSFNIVVQKSAPVIDETCVYFGDDAGTFRALDQQTGEVRWSYEIEKHPRDKGIFSSPALYHGCVYFGGYDGNVYSLSTRDGALRWKFSDADWIGSSPSLAPDLGYLFIGLEFGLWKKRGGIVALDMSNGNKIWSAVTEELTHCSPLYIKEERAVAIGSNDSIAYLYDSKTGAERWRFSAAGNFKTKPAYDPLRRLILFGSMDGNTYALRASDGRPIYSFPAGAGIYSTPLVHDDVFYVASLDKSLYAVELDTGKLLWEFQTAGRIFASPILADNSLWIGSNDGRLYELDPKGGSLRSSFQVSERIVNAVAYNEKSGHLFLPTHANEIYCLKEKEQT
ncbi:hypothetical protein A3A39_03470 [Candidatus Kaiserbacteria bacterium RIFCSPLOWO2_01_FULL_54_13]|uniref:Pyrrolo-quinoline quinone repeat domain-containing protein n=1 Tax=Candidatus Kaiserbacteria bacterium RIFCSPLOWO2_01_FULL_54_13 TaxID=1798512 RepID=A0A1F6F349_9BACT|nr:MAG: hypothetical protein A3A39_03470 [Candidatus Kaiserbacteria bacterium RIFCSPLOWO2_01_FULL_54_13]